MIPARKSRAKWACPKMCRALLRCGTRTEHRGRLVRWEDMRRGTHHDVGAPSCRVARSWSPMTEHWHRLKGCRVADAVIKADGSHWQSAHEPASSSHGILSVQEHNRLSSADQGTARHRR